jgi:hypothetical protein
MFLVMLVVTPLALAGQIAQSPLFSEGFEDAGLTSLGWYDGNRFALSYDAIAGNHSISATIACV